MLEWGPGCQMTFTLSYWNTSHWRGYNPFNIAWLWVYICFHTKLHCSTLQACFVFLRYWSLSFWYSCQRLIILWAKNVKMQSIMPVGTEQKTINTAYIKNVNFLQCRLKALWNMHIWSAFVGFIEVLIHEVRQSFIGFMWLKSVYWDCSVI